MKHYILDRFGEPKGTYDVNEWCEFFGQWNDSRRVAKETVGESEISTVFLALDHNFSGVGPPVLWETMVFGGPLDQEQTRCSGSREQALAMHQSMVDRVKAHQR